MALAENCGLNSVNALTEVKARQLSDKNPALGIDCMNRGTSGKFALYIKFLFFLLRIEFYKIKFISEIFDKRH